MSEREQRDARPCILNVDWRTRRRLPTELAYLGRPTTHMRTVLSRTRTEEGQSTEAHTPFGLQAGYQGR